MVYMGFVVLGASVNTGKASFQVRIGWALVSDLQRTGFFVNDTARRVFLFPHFEIFPPFCSPEAEL
jgi:hypothetical protein